MRIASFGTLLKLANVRNAALVSVANKYITSNVFQYAVIVMSCAQIHDWLIKFNSVLYFVSKSFYVQVGKKMEEKKSRHPGIFFPTCFTDKSWSRQNSTTPKN